jgi:hypothetical protein
MPVRDENAGDLEEHVLETLEVGEHADDTILIGESYDVSLVEPLGGECLANGGGRRTPDNLREAL